MERLEEERAVIVAKYGAEFRCYGNLKPECYGSHGLVIGSTHANWLINQIPEPCKTCLLKYSPRQ